MEQFSENNAPVEESEILPGEGAEEISEDVASQAFPPDSAQDQPLSGDAQNHAPILHLGTMHFRAANDLIRHAFETSSCVELRDTFAQRYIGCGMGEGKSLKIHGVPGNDLACYMDGGEIEVFGNAQDQIGNTMNEGRIVVHGRCGDAAGYGMRGGQIFVRDGCGWRVGIHMKQFEHHCPAIVVGGDAGSFLGEYMAGGIILLLGKPGAYLASGMHGGCIYMKHQLAPEDIPAGLVQEQVDNADMEIITQLLNAYNEYFAEELGAPVSPGELGELTEACESGETAQVDEPNTAADALNEAFFRLRPASSRPYANMYAD